MRVFAVEQCRTELGPVEGSVPDPPAVLDTLNREQERRKQVLGWRRTHKDPFEGEWEQVIAWLITNPERSSGVIFRELQRRSPGRYQPLQIPFSFGTVRLRRMTLSLTTPISYLHRLRLIEALTQTLGQHGEVLGSAAYVVARIYINLHLSLLRFHHFLPPIGAPWLFTGPEERDLARIKARRVICNQPVINV